MRKGRDSNLRGKIGLLGCGNMGEALVKGLVRSKTAHPNKIFVADRSPGRLAYLKKKYHINPVYNLEKYEGLDIIIIAVKPQQAVDALLEIAPHIRKRHLIISIMAGVSTSAIRKRLKNSSKIIRAMPNTPALIGCGMTGIYPKSPIAEAIFGSFGRVVVVRHEKDLDAVTAISGSGPAYVFKFTEGIMAAGRSLGLDEDFVKKLTLQTLLGATLMMLNTDESPEALRKKVTSKKGTTEAALKMLDKRKFATMIRSAVIAAHRRAKELREKFK